MIVKNEISYKKSLTLEDFNKKAVKLLFAFVFSILIAISANIFIYLPVTPVPITLQTMTVLFAAIVLGSRYALISTGTYVVTGLLGLPVFAGFKSGIATLAGPTGGYIIGFLISSYITAVIFENLAKNRKLSSASVFIACVSGISVIYLSGYIHMLIFFSGSSAYLTDGNIFMNTFNLAVRPFILADLLKILFIANAGIFVKNFSRS